MKPCDWLVCPFPGLYTTDDIWRLPAAKTQMRTFIRTSVTNFILQQIEPQVINIHALHWTDNIFILHQHQRRVVVIDVGLHGNTWKLVHCESKISHHNITVSTVVLNCCRATGQVNGSPQFSDPCSSKTPLTDFDEICYQWLRRGPHHTRKVRISGLEW